MNTSNYIECPKCKKKYHVKAGATCPHCKTDSVKLQEKKTKKKESYQEYKVWAEQTRVQKYTSKSLGNQEDDHSAGTILNMVAVIVSIGGLYFLLTAFYPALKLPSFFTPKGPSVTAKTIYQDFQTNELKAIDKYVGKLVTISGSYVDNGVTLGQPWIAIGKGILLPDVRCNIRGSSVKKATQLKPGQKIRVKGVVDKAMLGTVIVNDCEL